MVFVNAAAKELGVPCPTIDYKTEGTHSGPWTLNEATKPIAMGADRFFDGMTYDPKKLISYLRGFKVNAMKVSLDDLARLNS